MSAATYFCFDAMLVGVSESTHLVCSVHLALIGYCEDPSAAKVYANIPLGKKTIQDDSELLSSALAPL
jgi:hypothetical protein